MQKIVVGSYNKTDAAVVSALVDKWFCKICLENLNPGVSIVNFHASTSFSKIAFSLSLKQNVTCPYYKDDVQRHFPS